MTRTRSVFAGVSSSAAVGVLALAGGLILLPVVIHTVGAAPYGVWLILTSVAAVLNYSDLGVGTALIHFGSRDRAGDTTLGSGRELATSATLWSLAAAVVATPLFALFALAYSDSSALDRADATLMAGLAILLVFLSITLRPFAAVLISQGRLPRERMHQAVGTVFRVSASLVACLVFESIAALVIAEAIALLLPLVLSFVTVAISPSRPARIRRDTLSRTVDMLRYSVRAFAVNLTGVGILQAGTIIVGVVLGPTQTTYFAAAFRVYTSARQLMSWVLDPFRSTLSHLRATNEGIFREAVYSICTTVSVVAVVGSIGLSIAAPGLVPLWLGDSVPSDQIAWTIAILSSSLALNSIHLPLVPAGDASGQPGAFFTIQVVWLCAYIGLAIPLTATLGFVGTAIALVLPLPIIEAWYLARARRVLKLNIGIWRKKVMSPVGRIIAVQLVASLFASPLLLGPPHWSWLALAATSGASALLSLFLLRKRQSYAGAFAILRESL